MNLVRLWNTVLYSRLDIQKIWIEERKWKKNVAILLLLSLKPLSLSLSVLWILQVSYTDKGLAKRAKLRKFPNFACTLPLNFS